MVLTVSFEVSPETGLCCLRHRQKMFPPTWYQHRGIRTPRLRRPPRTVRHRWKSVHRIPHQTFVTIAKRPSWWGTGRAKRNHWFARRRKGNIFAWRLDGQISLNGFSNSRFWRGPRQPPKSIDAA